MIDRPGLAEFLRRRRESLQPEDVGLPRGPRRRHRLLVHTAVPGSESYRRLDRLLAIDAAQV